MSRPSQSRSQTPPPPDASIPRLRSPKLPARANPCCTACPFHPPDSVKRMESAFAPLENPLRLAFWEICSSEQERILRDCSPTLLVTDLEVALEAVPEGRIVGWSDWHAVVESAAPGLRTRPLRSADTPCIILYTSGTSGAPKAVVLPCPNVFFPPSNIRSPRTNVWPTPIWA